MKYKAFRPFQEWKALYLKIVLNEYVIFYLQNLMAIPIPNCCLI